MQGAVEHAAPIEAQSFLATGTDGASPRDTSGSLREVVAQRVAAHRSRRAGAEALEAAREAALRQERELIARENRRGVSKVRDTVRARYENSQSYREFLAAEAERALQQAQAEAEVAARNAKAIADAQMQLLEEMQQWETTTPSPREQALTEFRAEARSELAHELADIALGARELISEPPALSIVEAPSAHYFEHSTPSDLSDLSSRPKRTAASSAQRRDLQSDSPSAAAGDLFDQPAASPYTDTSAGFTVRLYEDLGPARQLPQLKDNDRRRSAYAENSFEELEELEQEIAFRRAPEFVNHIIETLPIPANLIEFPRQLIAARKARPRLAEGPLREEGASPEPQLRIFEVEPEQISVEPSVLEESVAAAEGPDWQGILLDTAPSVRPVRAEEAARIQSADGLPIASIGRRLMAAAVDGLCILAAFAAFSTVVSYIAGPGIKILPRPMLAAAAAVILAASYLIYQALFFTFSSATPGMLCARIGLCTFADENPTRQAMRRRILATALAACPLGLGLLWVWMDDDRLGWHDRISRMYQRAY